LRAARALLRWSARETAKRSGVALTTVQRLEQQDGVPGGRAQTLFDLQRTFESAGVEFIGSPSDRPGVRLARPIETRLENDASQSGARK
jgi:transcriptional regulator with XRE-family HTH domain